MVTKNFSWLLNIFLAFLCLGVITYFVMREKRRQDTITINANGKKRISKNELKRILKEKKQARKRLLLQQEEIRRLKEMIKGLKGVLARDKKKADRVTEKIKGLLDTKSPKTLKQEIDKLLKKINWKRFAEIVIKLSKLKAEGKDDKQIFAEDPELINELMKYVMLYSELYGMVLKNPQISEYVWEQTTRMMTPHMFQSAGVNLSETQMNKIMDFIVKNSPQKNINISDPSAWKLSLEQHLENYVFGYQYEQYLKEVMDTHQYQTYLDNRYVFGQEEGEDYYEKRISAKDEQEAISQLSKYWKKTYKLNKSQVEILQPVLYDYYNNCRNILYSYSHVDFKNNPHLEYEMKIKLIIAQIEAEKRTYYFYPSISSTEIFPSVIIFE